MNYLIALIIFACILYLRESAINSYKIGYYEQKLKNKNVDISHVENINFRGVMK